MSGGDGGELDAGWLAQMRKGVLEMCILAALGGEELYGYALVERLSTIPGLAITESTVYPLLARLARVGLLTSRLAASPNGPSRRYYRLSAAGTRRLHELRQAWTTVTQGVGELLTAVDSRKS